MDRVNFEINDVESFLKFPHIEPIVIITSISEDGTVDAAVETWSAFINLKLRMVTCSCNMQHQTAQNIQATKEFVVNFPSEDRVKETLLRARSIHPFRILWFISVV